jgi:hypothetical protein
MAPRDSSEGAQWLAKHKTITDRVAERKMAYSTSIRDQIISRSTPDDYLRGGGLFSTSNPPMQMMNNVADYHHLGARPRSSVTADPMSTSIGSMLGLASHGDHSSRAVPTSNPPSYTEFAHFAPPGFRDAPDVLVTNPSETGSHEREKMQRRLDTLRSTGPDPGHLAPPATRRRRTRTRSGSP